MKLIAHIHGEEIRIFSDMHRTFLNKKFTLKSMPLRVMKFSLASNWQTAEGGMTPARPAAIESCLLLNGEITIDSENK